MSTLNQSKGNTPRQEKSRMIHKILSFIKSRGFNGSVTQNELAQPSKQTYLAVWQFLLRQIDVTLTMPPSGGDELIIRVFECLGYKEKISKSVLRSFNSPPSWQQTLSLMCWLIDACQMEDELLIPILPPPSADGDGKIPNEILHNMVNAAKFAEPNSNVNWFEHYGRHRSFELQWSHYIAGDIDENQLIEHQVLWATQQAQEDKIESDTIDHKIETETSKLRNLECINKEIIDLRSQVANFRKEFNDYQSTLDAEDISVKKKNVDLSAIKESLASVNESIERYTAERKHLEDVIEQQECDRDQVITYQTEIEDLKEQLREIRSQRGAAQQKLRDLRSSMEKEKSEIIDFLRNIENALKMKILPKLKAENPAKARELADMYTKPHVDENRAIETLKSNPSIRPDSIELHEALLGCNLKYLLNELNSLTDQDSKFTLQISSETNMLRAENDKLLDALRQMESKKNEFRDEYESTYQELETTKARLESEISQLQEVISKCKQQIDGVDITTAQHMRELVQSIEEIDNQMESIRKAHQYEMKRYADALRLMEYKIERRTQRSKEVWSKCIEALQQLLFDRVGSELHTTINECVHPVIAEANQICKAHRSKY